MGGRFGQALQRQRLRFGQGLVDVLALPVLFNAFDFAI
jgi:hypothetical protein